MLSNVSDAQERWFEGEGVECLAGLGFKSGQRVLDFGAGPGRFTVPLSRLVAGNGGRVIAIDRSRDELDQLKQRLQAYGEPAAVDIRIVESEDNLQTACIETVDVVLVFDVLQHVKDWESFFGTARDMLKTDGALCVYPASVPHPGRVNMDAVRESLARQGFDETSCRRIRLPHAEDMVVDEIYVFEKRVVTAPEP